MSLSIRKVRRIVMTITWIIRLTIMNTNENNMPITTG